MKNKLIHHWAVTDAVVHDSRIFKEPFNEDNTCRAVGGADSAYRFPRNLKTLREWGLRERLQRKSLRCRPLSEREKRGNRTRSKIRSRVGHVFGAQAMQAGVLLMRSIGIGRARCKIGLRNLANTLDRFGHLTQESGWGSEKD